MNVDKRIKELKAMRARSKAYSSKALRIADELEKSFGKKTGAKAKTALKAADRARAISGRFLGVLDVTV
jgi:hypothetical protein